MSPTSGFGVELVRALARTSPAFEAPAPTYAPESRLAGPAVSQWSLLAAALSGIVLLAALYTHAALSVYGLTAAAAVLLLSAVLSGSRPDPKCAAPTTDEGGIWLLLETLALRDPSVLRHAVDVARYADELAAAAGLSEYERMVVHTAGLVHDIGKEALPDHVLVGRGELQEAEWKQVRRHPADGARLLLRTEGLTDVAAAVLGHHERVDGSGYPKGLVGDAIPLSARILAVAEVYATLIAPDGYRLPLSAADARAELLRVAGSQLDARLVELFLTRERPDAPQMAIDLEAELAVLRAVRGPLDVPWLSEPPRSDK